MMNRVTVLGSINLDTTIRMKRLPQPGETVHSHELFSSGGGKGANQAIAAQRSNAKTYFIGAVGNDDAGKMLLELLSQDGVDTLGIRTLENERTGTAIVMVDDSAENSIIIYSGANMKIQLNKVAKSTIKQSDFLLSQFEINTNVIVEAFQLARDASVKTVLNPAPASSAISKELLNNTDIFIPNKSEAEIITGIKIESMEDLKKAGKIIQQYGIELVIITLGEKGSYFLHDNGEGIVAAQVVKAVDTTAAGDTFIGALSSVLKKDYSNLEEAIQYASRASAMTVQRFGAQPSIPYAKEIF